MESLLSGKAEVVGKFTNPITAVENVAGLSPDAVFLDVEMPGLSGLEAAAEMSALLPKAAIIFVTAHGHYAVDAFELNAVDYLVKPVQPDRLNKALERIVQRHDEGRQAEAAEKLHLWLNGSLAASRRSTVSLWRGRHLEVVPVERIACCFVAKGARTVSVVADGRVYQATGGLIDFVRKAGLSQLLRCNRSYFLNPAKVKRLEPGKDETLNAHVPGFPEAIPVSRKYRPEVLQVLKSLHES
jgi:DNA-binding LytR/AlgR family response regulator